MPAISIKKWIFAYNKNILLFHRDTKIFLELGTKGTRLLNLRLDKNQLKNYPWVP